MFRFVLPVAVCLFGQSSLAGEEIAKPLNKTQMVDAGCENIVGAQQNCVRVLACIGETGLYFDGVARGWDAGSLMGRTSAGTLCFGKWSAGGLLGSGTAEMRCMDGLTVNLIFYTQDNSTGTVIGRGMDSENRVVRAWSGNNVLQFLTGPNGRPRMECGTTEVLIG